MRPHYFYIIFLFISSVSFTTDYKGVSPSNDMSIPIKIEGKAQRELIHILGDRNTLSLCDMVLLKTRQVLILPYLALVSIP